MVLLALVASALLGLAFPLVVRYLLDAAFVQGSRALLDRIALGLIAIFSAQALLNYVQTYWLGVTGERAIAGLRREVFAKLIRMPPGFFADRRTGELISRLTADIGMLQNVLSHQIAEASRQILALLGGIIILTAMQPRLVLTALAVAPVVVGITVFFARGLRRISTGVQDRLAEATAAAEEAFGQIRTVQSFVQEAAEEARYGDRIAASVRAALRRAHIRGVFFGVLTFITFGGILVVLREGGLLVLEGKLTPGSLVSFLLYTVAIAAAVGALAAVFGSYQEAVGAAERVFEILDMPVPIESPPAPVALAAPTRGEVVFDRVSFRYGPALPLVLHEIALHCRPGETVAIVGPSGSGKTTLVSLIPRFWDVTDGRLLLDGTDVRARALADLRGAIGVVPQEPALFSGTIRENIAYARPTASPAEVEAAARAAHAHEFAERLPQGYETVVGERGVKLSGGQRQRVAIARAILKNPAVLILDEATSSLDTESEQLIEDALGRLLVGRTTLIIAHRLSTVRRADRLIVLEHGRIVEEGTHAVLLARGGLYSRLYQRQFRDGDEALAER